MNHKKGLIGAETLGAQTVFNSIADALGSGNIRAAETALLKAGNDPNIDRGAISKLSGEIGTFRETRKAGSASPHVPLSEMRSLDSN